MLETILRYPAEPQLEWRKFNTLLISKSFISKSVQWSTNGFETGGGGVLSATQIREIFKKNSAALGAGFFL